MSRYNPNQPQPRANNSSRVFQPSTSSFHSSSSKIKIADDGRTNDVDIGLAGKSKPMKRTYNIQEPLPPIHEIDLQTYRNWIIDLLMKRGNVTRSEAERYTDSAGMERFILAVTHDSVSPLERAKNYEMLEHLGDASVNKATTWYLKGRFPDVIARGDPGVEIISKQKSLLTSKPYLAKYSEALSLSKFIRYRSITFTYIKKDESGQETTELKQIVIDQSMKEDVFEAFFGCLEEVIDNKEKMVGVGYSVLFKILSSFYDEQDIPTSLSLLKDAKSQVKEIFDGKKYGILVWDKNKEARTYRVLISFTNPPNGEAPYELEFGPYSTSVNRSGDGGEDYETNIKIIEQVGNRAALNYLRKRYPNERAFDKYNEKYN